jgi:hypothetical protein
MEAEMTGRENPHESPNASSEDLATHRFYSIGQIGVATALGTVMLGSYFLARNYSLFNMPKKAIYVWISTAILVPLLLALGYVMPESASRSAPTFVVVVAYMNFARWAFREQIVARRGQGWLPYSWWRVIGLSIAVLAAVLSVVLIASIVYVRNT